MRREMSKKNYGKLRSWMRGILCVYVILMPFFLNKTKTEVKKSGAEAQAYTSNATSCVFDFHLRKWNI